MNKISYIFKYILALLVIGIYRVLLPSKGKKMTYIASMYSQLVEAKILENVTIDKLNSRLHLVSQPEALQLPMELGSVIWKDVSFKNLLKEELGSYHICNYDHCIPFDDAQLISAKIVEITPNWLKYDTTTNMVRDVATLFYATSAKV